MIYIEFQSLYLRNLKHGSAWKKSEIFTSKNTTGRRKAETSALTFDEVFWAIKKLDFEAALEAAHALLNFPNLEIISVHRDLSLSALQIIKEYHLAPRDAIHAATAIAAKAEVVVSTDAHFDKIKELKRRSL